MSEPEKIGRLDCGCVYDQDGWSVHRLCEDHRLRPAWPASAQGGFAEGDAGIKTIDETQDLPQLPEWVFRELDRHDEEADAFRKALAMAHLDREGDLATICDLLNSCLRESFLPEVTPDVASIKGGILALLHALNRRTEDRDHARYRSGQRQKYEQMLRAILAECGPDITPSMGLIDRARALLAEEDTDGQ